MKKVQVKSSLKYLGPNPIGAHVALIDNLTQRASGLAHHPALRGLRGVSVILAPAQPHRKGSFSDGTTLKDRAASPSWRAVPNTKPF